MAGAAASKAIALAKQCKSVCIFSRLDRLARNAEFMLRLQNSGPELRFCDMPEVKDRSTLGVLKQFIIALSAHWFRCSFAAVSGLPRQRSIHPYKRFCLTFGKNDFVSVQGS